MQPVVLDGRMGEGGGQVLRTALSAAVLTGRPLQISHIRGGRIKPGLLRQHLTCVRAAVAISSGKVEGNALGSSHLSFIPGPIRGGEFAFDVGSAGSANLVLQTVLPPLLRAAEPSTVTIIGGTHNRNSPPTDDLQHCFIPALRQMGAAVELTLERHGFEPQGGGKLVCSITPTALRPLSLTAVTNAEDIEVKAIVSGISPGIGRRLVAQACTLLGVDPTTARVETVAADGAGGVLRLRTPGLQSTGFCARNVRAERVAEQAAGQFQAWLHAKVPVGEFTADQLLLPMVLAGGGVFRTALPSLHLTTNAAVIQQFYAVDIRMTHEDNSCLISITSV
jgi:RNA 3'-terminal phosphate cyclase (ATP)